MVISHHRCASCDDETAERRVIARSVFAAAVRIRNRRLRDFMQCLCCAIGPSSFGRFVNPIADVLSQKLFTHRLDLLVVLSSSASLSSVTTAIIIIITIGIDMAVIGKEREIIVSIKWVILLNRSSIIDRRSSSLSTDSCFDAHQNHTVGMEFCSWRTHTSHIPCACRVTLSVRRCCYVCVCSGKYECVPVFCAM